MTSITVMAIEHCQFMVPFEYPPTSLTPRLLGITAEWTPTVDTIWLERFYAESFQTIGQEIYKLHINWIQ